MKADQTELRLVQLSSVLNKTKDLFQGEYGEGFEAIPLEKMANISSEVVNSIVRVIEYSLEFARD